jgi:hypothetical protein
MRTSLGEYADIRTLKWDKIRPELTFTLTHTHPPDAASKSSLDIIFKILFRDHPQNATSSFPS